MASCALMVLGCFVAWRERLVRGKVKISKAGPEPGLSPMKVESVLERQDKVSLERPEKLF